jgi:hypothetical protein
MLENEGLRNIRDAFKSSPWDDSPPSCNHDDIVISHLGKSHIPNCKMFRIIFIGVMSLASHCANDEILPGRV